MKKFKVWLFFPLAVLILFQQCSQKKSNEIFDVLQLKDKNPDEISVILATKPDSSFNRHFVEGIRFIQLYYHIDSSEFRYVEGKLKEIIIHKPGIPFDPHSIVRFGLEYETPSAMDTSSFIRWDTYPDFKAVSYYRVGEKKDPSRQVMFKAYFNYKD